MPWISWLLSACFGAVVVAAAVAIDSYGRVLVVAADVAEKKGERD